MLLELIGARERPVFGQAKIGDHESSAGSGDLRQPHRLVFGGKQQLSYLG